MTSAIATAARAAHAVATSILGHAQIQAGATIPAATDLKENAADETIQLDLAGKNIIVSYLF